MQSAQPGSMKTTVDQYKEETSGAEQRPATVGSPSRIRTCDLAVNSRATEKQLVALTLLLPYDLYETPRRSTPKFYTNGQC